MSQTANDAAGAQGAQIGRVIDTPSRSSGGHWNFRKRLSGHERIRRLFDIGAVLELVRGQPFG